MKTSNFIIVIILFLSFYSCIDFSSVPYRENDSIIYALFDPEIIISKDNPYELDIDRDLYNDLGFEVETWNETKNEAEYLNRASRIISLNNLTLSWGAQGSSFKYYIENGDVITSKKFIFDEGVGTITLTGEKFGKKSGVWDADEKKEGYIGFYTENEKGCYYGWVNLSITDSTINLIEFGYSKNADLEIRAGEKP